MNDLDSIESANAYNESSLDELTWSIETGEGEFALILAHCNYEALQQVMAQRLRQRLQEGGSVAMRELVLKRDTRTLYTAIWEELGGEKPAALMVMGLEAVNDLDGVLKATNQVREEFRKNLQFPLVLWVNDAVLRQLIRIAPDFESWATATRFVLATEQLVEGLHAGEAQLFDRVLNADPERFLVNEDILGAKYRQELNSDLMDLRSRGQELDASLQSSIDFVWGRAAYARDEIETALECYWRSLGFWEQRAEGRGQEAEGRAKAEGRGQEAEGGAAEEEVGEAEEEREAGEVKVGPSTFPEQNAQEVGNNTQHLDSEVGAAGLERKELERKLERKGVVLFHIGLCYRRWAEQKQAESSQYWQDVRRYFQQSLAVFEWAQRLDLVARFINPLGEVLQCLEDWDALQALGLRSRTLNANYKNPAQKARACSFLAEVALQQGRWKQAKQLMQQALELIAAVPEVQCWQRSLYRFLLARAQQQLGAVEAAIVQLEAAAENGPGERPQLHIQILETLQTLYWQQKRYLDAFGIKQEQRSIEQVFGMRAFVGATELRPRQQANVMPLAQTAPAIAVAEEIIASGRQQDISRLLERIGSTQHCLTILYSQAGVGKSSLLEAGLMPALQQKVIGTREVLSIRVKRYDDWVQEVENGLTQALSRLQVRNLELSNLPTSTLTSLSQKLRQNGQHNLLTVLIFDRFEEFFWIVRDRNARHSFFQFFRDCLNIPFANVILSLQTDYLHLLLENTRHIDLDAINNDILHKEILYPLDNFSPEAARATLHSLTARAQIAVEAVLVDELVKDLASDRGDIAPIELQVVGTQLLAENLTALDRYRQYSSRRVLVQHYLDAIVADCGPENQTLAEQVLYLLTAENDARPSKTQTELEDSLPQWIDDPLAEIRPLELVLAILCHSGLVVVSSECPHPRYQLVHDFLVPCIRQRQKTELEPTLAPNSQPARRSELESANSLQQQLRHSRRTAIGLAMLSGVFAIATAFSITVALQARKSEINTRLASSELLLTSGRQLEALVESLQAGQQVQQSLWLGSDIRTQTTNTLRSIVYRIQEQNRMAIQDTQFGSVSFSPNGQHLATTSSDGSIRLWDLQGRQLQSIKLPGSDFPDIHFSPDGQHLAVATTPGIIWLWHLSSKKVQQFKRHNARAYSVSFSPDGQAIAAAFADGTVKVWNRQGQQLQQLQVFTFAPTPPAARSVRFSPNGQSLAVAFADGTVRIWDRQNNLLVEFKGHAAAIRNISISPKGQHLATTAADGTARLWNFQGKQLRQFKLAGTRIERISFSSDGQLLATVAANGTAHLWTLQGKRMMTFEGHRAAINGVSFSPDNRALATAAADGTVRLWNLQGKQAMKFKAIDAAVNSIRFSPDGRSLATADADGTIRLWDIQGKPLVKLEQPDGEAVSVSFSPNGQRLATASLEGTVRLWTPQGTELHSFEGHSSGIWDIAFSPDGESLATASIAGIVQLWDIQGTQLQSFQGHRSEVFDVSFSPDGQYLATASLDSTVRLWNLQGQQLQELAGDGTKATSVSFHPDGQQLVAAYADGTIRMWNLQGQELQAFRAHKSTIWSTVLSPNGQQLATASEDGTIRLWNLQGRQLVTFDAQAKIYSLSFNADGQSIAAASADGTVQLWRIEGLNTLLARGCTWVQDYLENPVANTTDRSLCDRGQ